MLKKSIVILYSSNKISTYNSIYKFKMSHSSSISKNGVYNILWLWLINITEKNYARCQTTISYVTNPYHLQPRTRTWQVSWSCQCRVRTWLSRLQDCLRRLLETCWWKHPGVLLMTRRCVLESSSCVRLLCSLEGKYLNIADQFTSSASYSVDQ